MFYIALLYIPTLISSEETYQLVSSSAVAITADVKLQQLQPRPADLIRREGGHSASSRREKFIAGAVLETSSSDAQKSDSAYTLLSASPIMINYLIYGNVLILLAVVALHRNSDKSHNPRPTECWTGFRAVVSTWIFFEHATSILWKPSESLRMPASGAFFVMSGAALGLDRTFETQYKQFKARDYCAFLAKRLGKVLPLYWLALALSRAEKPVSVLQALISLPYDDWVSFFALQTWTDRPLIFHWFISCIVQVYLLHPFLCMAWHWIGTRRHLSRCATVVLISYSVQWMLCLWLWTFPGDLPINGPQCKYLPRDFFGFTLKVYTNCIFRLPEFILGNMVSHTLSVLDDADKSGRSLLSPGQQRIVSFVTDIFPALMLGLAAIVRALIGQYSDASDCGHFLVIALFMNLASPLWCLWLFGMAYGSTRKGSWCEQVLSSKYFLAVGQASYGIYIYSIFMIQQTRNIGIAYIATLSVAFSSFYVIEEPISWFIRSTLQRHGIVKKSTEGVK